MLFFSHGRKYSSFYPFLLTLGVTALLSLKKDNFIPDTDLLHNDRFKGKSFISGPVTSTISPSSELLGALVIVAAEHEVSHSLALVLTTGRWTAVLAQPVLERMC